jgi:hypothetical protein
MFAERHSRCIMHHHLVARLNIDTVRHGMGVETMLRLLDIDVAANLQRLSAKQLHDV